MGLLQGGENGMHDDGIILCGMLVAMEWPKLHQPKGANDRDAV